jgi:Protein of unknown function (DUF1697)
MVYRHYPSTREHERHRNDQEEVTNYAAQSDGVHRMRYVALLRGINVGGKTLIKMTDLKTCIEELGLDDVSTFIASGNVLFESDEHDAAKLQTKIERAIEQRFRLPMKGVPPSRTSTTASTPAEKNRFEMIPARWSPNAPDMTNIAAGNETITARTHPRADNADVTWCEPEPAIENASAARTVMRTNNTAASAALEAVAAAPQPPLPASRSTLESAAPNQSSSSKAEKDGGDENSSSVAVEERDQLRVRRAQLRLTAVEHERDDEQDGGNDAAAGPHAFPIRHGNHLHSIEGDPIASLRPRPAGVELQRALGG